MKEMPNRRVEISDQLKRFERSLRGRKLWLTEDSDAVNLSGGPLAEGSEDVSNIQYGPGGTVVMLSQNGAKRPVCEQLDPKDPMRLAFWRISHPNGSESTDIDIKKVAERLDVSTQMVHKYLNQGIGDLSLLLKVQRLSGVNHMLLFETRRAFDREQAKNQVGSRGRKAAPKE
jgi:hypothetical protein